MPEDKKDGKPAKKPPFKGGGAVTEPPKGAPAPQAASHITKGLSK